VVVRFWHVRPAAGRYLACHVIRPNLSRRCPPRSVGAAFQAYTKTCQWEGADDAANGRPPRFGLAAFNQIAKLGEAPASRGNWGREAGAVLS
jgi:hypothetical protein